MKQCTKCGIEKEPTDYYFQDKKTGRLHSHCKACHKELRKKYHATHYIQYGEQYRERARQYHRKVREEFRENFLEFITGKSCVVCGESDIRVLEMDHLDSSTKSFSISQATRLGHSWSLVIAELKKCQVLCANCHKRKTAEQFGWYKARS